MSNFEAGEVKNKAGSHLAEYVYCYPDPHLKKTFEHPDVKERGLTRLEISIYGFDSSISYLNILKKEIKRVDEPIFYIQPGTQQWLNLASFINQSCVIANRKTSQISHIWYGSSKTGRYAGVNGKFKESNYVKRTKKRNRKTKENEENKENKETEETKENEENKENEETKEYTEEEKKKINKYWKKAINWMISEYGFSKLPIFLIEFNIIDQKIVMEPLKCFIKNGSTTLTTANNPTQCLKKIEEEYKELDKSGNFYGINKRLKYPDIPLISSILPDTENIKWNWREERVKNALGKNKIIHEIHEIPTNRLISLLSTREREALLYDIRNEYECEQWREKINIIIEEDRKNYFERKKEIEKEKKRIQIYFNQVLEAEKREKEIDNDFKVYTDTQEIKNELEKNKYIYVYGFKIYPTVIRLAYYDKEGKKGVCFANGKIHNIMLDIKDELFKKIDENKIKHKPKCPVFVLPCNTLKVSCKNINNLIFDFELKPFTEEHNLNVENERLKKIQEKYEKLQIEENKKIPTLKYMTIENNESVKAVNIEEGEYQAWFFCDTIFRGKRRDHLLLQQEGKEPFSAHGSFLQKEIEKMGNDLTKIQAPIYINFGQTKTDSNKTKDRITTIAWKFAEE